MHIDIDRSGEPIYEQIKDRIRAMIFSGELKAGEMLPSIRALAKGLKIGIITAKRAYDDLCAEKILYSEQGKGVFVSPIKKEKLDDIKQEKLRQMLVDAKAYAKQNGIEEEQIKKIIKETFEDKNVLS